MLLCAAPLAAGAQATADGAPIRLADALTHARESADAVVKAKEALSSALRELSDAAPWKGASVGAELRCAGELDPDPKKPAAEPFSYSASLGLPILHNLRASASTKFDGAWSASLSWSPLAYDQSGASARLAVAKAEIALDAARSQAKLAALTAYAQALSAEAQLRSAGAARAKAELELGAAEAARRLGEVSEAALAKARAAALRSQAAERRAESQLEAARLSLATAVGGAMGEALRAGAPLDASSAAEALAPDWRPPAYRAGKAVLEAALALEQARASSIFSVSGPVSLSASASSSGAFSLGGSISLDYKTITGSTIAKRSRAIEAAEEALRAAMEADEREWRSALLGAELASLSLTEAETALAQAQAELDEARVLWRLGELLPAALAEAELARDKAALDLELARIELARSRFALE
jgi:outer membrane protein TolC